MVLFVGFAVVNLYLAYARDGSDYWRSRWQRSCSTGRGGPFGGRGGRETRVQGLSVNEGAAS